MTLFGIYIDPWFVAWLGLSIAFTLGMNAFLDWREGRRS